MNPPHATVCWLCVGSDRSSSSELPKLLPAAGLPHNSEIQKNQSRVQTLCAALLVMCIVLTILIGIGLAVQDPGTLIAYAIFVGPAYLATGVRALYGMSREDQPKASTLLLTFLFSGVFHCDGRCIVCHRIRHRILRVVLDAVMSAHVFTENV